MTCPNCGRCPYLEGQCVERIAKGRRFFLMGALALPLAHKIEKLAPILAPEPALTAGGAEFGSGLILLYREAMGNVRWEIKYGHEGFDGVWKVHDFDGKYG